MGIIIINRSRVRKQLEVIDDPQTEIYAKLTPEQKDAVEVIRRKGPADTTEQDFKDLLAICEACC